MRLFATAMIIMIAVFCVAASLLSAGFADTAQRDIIETPYDFRLGAPNSPSEGTPPTPAAVPGTGTSGGSKAETDEDANGTDKAAAGSEKHAAETDKSETSEMQAGGRDHAGASDDAPRHATDSSGSDNPSSEDEMQTDAAGPSSGEEHADESKDGSAQERQAVRGIKSISGTRFISTQDHGSFNLNLSKATGDVGAPIDEIMKLDGNSWTGDGSDAGSYTFWKLSLKGDDGDIHYGDKQKADTNESNTGTDISRLKVDASGEIEFMPEKTGTWTKVNSRKADLQFAFYYLQNMRVGDNPTYVEFHVSDWFLTDFTPPGRSSSTGRAIIIEVVDQGTGDQLAKSGTMYYYNRTPAVETLTADAVDLRQFQITGIDKFKAANQSPENPWTTTDKADKSSPLASYTYAQMHDGSMNVNWESGDPNHVIFTVSVSRTAQVSVVKRLTGTDADQYRDSVFTFSAQLEVPDDNPLAQVYPATGLADGSSEVRVTRDASYPSRGEITGIAARPDGEITIRGLPPETKVRFSETGAPDRDPSVFTTVYDNDVTHSSDGSATAREIDQSGADRPQTVTTTNKVSPGSGKLSISKTFTGLKQLTSQDRINLSESFLIEADGKAFPALLLNNYTGVDPAGGILDESADTVSYSWELKRVGTGPTTLTERNYTVASTGVAAQVSVNGGPATLSDRAAVSISESGSKIEFANEYGVPVHDVTISKVWDRVDPSDQLPVTVELDWHGTKKDSSGDLMTGIVGTYTLDESDGWQIVVPNLPAHGSSVGDISYSACETKVGDLAPEEAGFDSAVSPETGTDFTVTNKRTRKISLKIKKIDEVDETALPGAKFALTDEGGAQIGDEETGAADGIAAFQDLTVGTYLVKETSAPAGYQLAAHADKLVVDEDAVTVFTPDPDGGFPDAGVLVPVGDDGAYHMTFSDRKAPELPSTGPAGRIGLPQAAAGAVALTAAIYALASALGRRAR